MPLSDDLITSFVSTLEKIVSAAVENGNKLTNLSMSCKISQYGESFVKDSKIQVEQLSPVFLVQNTINANDPILVLTQADTAALIADKMMGQENTELTFTDDKHEAYSNALLQSAKAALESFEEITSAGLQLTESKLIMADPANEESLSLAVDADRYLFEINLNIEGVGEKVVYLDMSSRNINTLLSLFEGSEQEAKQADGDETVGDFMGTDFAEIIDSHDPNDVDTAKNLNLLMDIRLGLIVELGRAEMHLRDILKLTKGSIIELDRLSGEPVDLFVNNKLIARGEVVVIDDNFGLRINQLAGSTGKDKKLIGAKD